MTATWQKLLGEQLLRRPPSDDQATTIAVSELNDKVAALYFSYVQTERFTGLTCRLF